MAERKCSIVFAEMPSNNRFVDLTGRVFVRMTVVGFAGMRGSSRAAYWICECECGTVKEIQGVNLKSGNTTSCGCRIREITSARVMTHGLRKNGGYGSPELRSYQGAKARCNNPRDRRYRSYGGRGIEFRFTSFDEFIQCVGMKPDRTWTIDRINNDGHYEPGNVRWASPKKQANNRRDTIYATVDGVTRPLTEWLSGKKYESARYHIRKCGRNAEEVVKCFLAKS